eukprot:Phypoly_transcript_02941.p1 GENE.Phypoly_transcript_02941~~Phypoly_transcript_02941.p1  ORF type:complete len:784 (+),score=123.34 Phypoly_transcript_02941:139-2490(+)
MAMSMEDDVGLLDEKGNGEMGDLVNEINDNAVLLGSISMAPPEKVTNHSSARKLLLSIVGDETSPQALVLGFVMVLLISLSVFAFFPEASRHPDLPAIVLAIDVVATIVFMVEHILRIIAAPDVRAYVTSSSSIINFVSFLPLPLEAVIKAKAEGVSLERWVRLFHVLRMIRFLKFFQYGYIFRRVIPYKKIAESPDYQKHKELIHHIWDETYEQIKAVIPISVYAILYEYVILGMVVGNLGIIFGGQLCVIGGLFFFLEGLRLSIMPIGEFVSMMLPRFIRLAWVMLAAFVLGIIVTYAEPAIGALAILGELVPRKSAPYLSFLLSEWTQPLTLFVGIGVGLAAAVGVLRVRYGWTLRKVIFISMVPCAIMTAICVLLIPELEVVVGLAWDCGAVTTGPVTVPVVLALGSGVAQSMGNADNLASATFGIVTLASLFPIVTVQLLAIIAYMSVSQESILAKEGIVKPNITEESPYRETINGIRAIAPAVLFFFVLGRFVMKHKVNHLIVESVSPTKKQEASLGPEDSVFELEESVHHTHFELGTEILEDIPDDFESEGPHATAQGKQKKKIRVFWVGVAAALIGMIMFNYGITYGLAELGEEVGTALPGTFSFLPQVPESPQYSKTLGVFFVGLFALVLGYLCTQAEPGLIVFGDKVEQLKVMPRKTLVVSVAIGVAMGMCFGVIKIVYDLQLIYFILVSYGIALVMTYFSEEQIVCVAWDSAGVTTGEITVSFILVLGVSLSAASKSTEGFGILTMASVGPIISVLTAGFWVKFQKYRNGEQ